MFRSYTDLEYEAALSVQKNHATHCKSHFLSGQHIVGFASCPIFVLF